MTPILQCQLGGLPDIVRGPEELRRRGVAVKTIALGVKFELTAHLCPHTPLPLRGLLKHIFYHLIDMHRT